MSTSDWSTLISNLLTVYLLYRQNKIFERQNEIFAGTGAEPMPSSLPGLLRRYWPMIVMAMLVVLFWSATAYTYADRHFPGRLGPPWIFLATLLCLVVVLLGAGHTVIQSQSSGATRVLRDMRSAPRLQADFIKTGSTHSLRFKADKIAFVDKVGPLVCKERYESIHEFRLVPSKPPRIDPGASVESKIYGLRQSDSPDIRSLLDILRSGDEKTVDSVIVDYHDDHGGEFSRRFDLTRNQDDSVAWIPETAVRERGKAEIPEPQAKDLVDLRRDRELALRFPEEQTAAVNFGNRLEAERQRVLKLRAAHGNAILAAQLSLLADEAQHLEDWLATILSENQICSYPIDLSRPLQYSLICLQESSGETITLPWQRIRLMAFRDGYASHRLQLSEKNYANYDWAPPKLPIDLEVKDVMAMFANYRKGLRGKIDELADPFTKALNE